MRSFIIPLVLCVAAACTGVITTPPIVAPPPPPPAEPKCEHTLVPGRPPIHRLTRLEYDRTVDAVLGDSSALAAASFPTDPSHAGFDHVSDVQTVSVLHAERYEEAAWRLALALWEREYDPGLLKRWEAETRSEDGGYEVVRQSCCGPGQGFNVVSADARAFYTAYRIFVQTDLDRGEADYTVKFSGWSEYPTDGGQLLPDGGVRPVSWQVQLDSRFPFFSAPVTGTRAAPRLYTATVHVEAPGIHQIDIWLDDPTVLSNPPVAPVGWVDWFSVERAPTTATNPKVRQCDLSTGTACVTQTFSALLEQAYRRPVTQAEVDAVTAVFTAARADSDTLAEAFQAGIVAVLLSPHFLYRVELDGELLSTTPHPVSAHELAARLSYFLTSAPPDAQLRAAADDGTLMEPQVLQSHAERLWSSPAMVQNLGSQLMSTRALDVISPSPGLFPAFDAPLRTAMGQEAELLFSSVFTQDRPMGTLVDADYAFVNDRLAQHYGLPLPGSAVPVRVALGTSTERGGALALGSVLALNSTPARPSQVLRGKWVLTNLLCDEPDAPPALIPPLGSAPGKTSRELLEEHAKNPFCASCHQRMDPIGFALDHYDADGAYRLLDRQGNAIDSRGQFPDGTAFDGLPGLRTALARDVRLEQCMAQQLLTYALAREPKLDDRCHAEGLAAKVHGQSFEALMRELVKSEPFRMRQAEGEVGP